MTSPDKLIQLYQRTQWIIAKQTEGLTHADSLLQLPFRGNCLNWVLGHILVYRDKVLELLGETPILSDSQTQLYRRGSEALTDGEAAVPLEKLLEALKQSGERLVAALGNVTAGRLEAIADEENQRSVGERIEFMQWHETYHVGQLEILRQLAGKNDAII
jgi:uncharacterized damage-inducible protein DinB